MRIAGDAVLHGTVDAVWDALLDPAVLVRTIPGCERLETTGEHQYAMTLTVGVASVKGTYAGTVELRDLKRAESLTMNVNGSGAQGTIGAGVAVAFGDNGDGTTRVTYDADAVVGGPLGGVGQRMLTSVSRRMAGDFFTAVDRVLTGQEAVAEPAPGERAGAERGAVFTAPPRPDGDREQFVQGLVVGGALVLLGVAVGVAAARRRR